ncbi:hypothetical protein GKZ89_08815 [Bacillus mangrovi]|uniref:Peptidoglycan binding-like domain-containing protein n=1 Tax=Metabacillus mangrovi TaxID=1491830 RepID=A0A7X2V4Z4_9BACI|nr:peptidoglycan-binding domain-containing protein [Metabacillus mangrovi]MTH53518.1 hypothetical protein [Metabacillus mangrovi]
MKKKWFALLPAIALVTAPVSFQTAAAYDEQSALTSELPPDLEPVLQIAPEHQPVLRTGEAGLEVAFVQATLTQTGFETVSDGFFGPHTEQKVREFQAENGLAADGVVGIETWTKLFSVHEQNEFTPEQAISFAEKKLNNDDLVFSSNGVEYKDLEGTAYYSLKAQSKKWMEDGGTGTVGFYNVYEDGTVMEAESLK